MSTASRRVRMDEVRSRILANLAGTLAAPVDQPVSGPLPSQVSRGTPRASADGPRTKRTPSKRARAKKAPSRGRRKKRGGGVGGVVLDAIAALEQLHAGEGAAPAPGVERPVVPAAIQQVLQQNELEVWRGLAIQAAEGNRAAVDMFAWALYGHVRGEEDIERRLGVTLEEAKRCIQAVHDRDGMTLDQVIDESVNILAGVVVRWPERAADIREAIFGEGDDEDPVADDEGDDDTDDEGAGGGAASART